MSTNLGPDGRFLLREQLRAFHDANARLAHYDRHVEDGLVEFCGRFHLLMTIPGIDRASARAILVELSPDIGVFPYRHHCAAWAGLCPRNHQSAGKRRHGRTRRDNITLCEVLRETPEEGDSHLFRGHFRISFRKAFQEYDWGLIVVERISATGRRAGRDLEGDSHLSWAVTFSELPGLKPAALGLPGHPKEPDTAELTRIGACFADTART